jgi:hypothetical protein
MSTTRAGSGHTAWGLHQIGLKPTLQAFLIVAESGDKGGEKSWRNFSSSEIGNVFACTTTTSDPIDKRKVQTDSAHQIGLKPTLQAVHAVQGSEETLGGILSLRNSRPFCS